MIEANPHSFQDVADAIARQIVLAEANDDVAYIRLPLRYPGGTSVVVRVTTQPSFVGESKRFSVTDHGLGYEEAATMGVGTIYVRHARGIADRVGITYQDYAFFVEGVSRDQLPGAVVAVANCSFEAVAMVAERVEEIEKETEGEILYKRLVRVFSEKNVARNAEVVGASTTAWPVDNLVTSNSHETIFEAVSVHRNSVYAANTKFGDIREVEIHPKCIAVVRSKPALKTMLTILAKAANSVVEHDIATEALRRLAAESSKQLN
jgi:hypothetical protein